MAADMGISPGQLMTRRRALGRRLIRKSSDLSVMCGTLQSDPDLVHLTDKERRALDKAVANASKISQYLDKLGSSLDQP